MRVDLHSSAASQISNEQDTRQVSANGTAKSAYAAHEDRTTLTSGSASLASLVSAALQTPAVRQDKVDSLRHAVSNGEYKLDPGKIAGAILDELRLIERDGKDLALLNREV